MSECNPFELFPAMARTCDLSKPAAPGLKSEVVAVLNVMVKTQTASDDFTDYNSRNLQRRFHIETCTLPAEYVSGPDMLLGMNLVLNGHRYRINQVSRGDDFDLGDLPFVSVMAVPAGRKSA